MSCVYPEGHGIARRGDIGSVISRNYHNSHSFILIQFQSAFTQEKQMFVVFSTSADVRRTLFLSAPLKSEFGLYVRKA